MYINIASNRVYDLSPQFMNETNQCGWTALSTSTAIQPHEYYFRADNVPVGY